MDPLDQLLSDLDRIAAKAERDTLLHLVSMYHLALTTIDKALLLGMDKPAEALAAIARCVEAVESVFGTAAEILEAAGHQWEPNAKADE